MVAVYMAAALGSWRSLRTMTVARALMLTKSRQIRRRELPAFLTLHPPRIITATPLGRLEGLL